MLADFRRALQTWDDAAMDADAEYIARKRLIEASRQLLLSVPGVVGVDKEAGTSGSIYFVVSAPVADSEYGESASIPVRVSNHARKPNGHERPAWSFEVGDDEATHERGLVAVEKCLQDAIENW